MFFTEPGKVADYLMCANEQEGAAITRGLPADSDKPPVAKPQLEAHAMDSSVAAGPKEINYANLFEQEQKDSTSKKKGGLEETSTRMAFFNLTMPGRLSCSEIFNPPRIVFAPCTTCTYLYRSNTHQGG